eukprot:CAMPEP_0180257056 /NCGR_PEP_ID=MMETSP0987-20121128/41623_1 /TAXON_ID=697907 /ORGANISM="non described non described, Strain CCMP2293" /LENGTH=38 /DNA_ID= /DNA_START= /DNA_END= /DNA_ORIENTATION=
MEIESAPGIALPGLPAERATLGLGAAALSRDATASYSS